MFKAPSQIRRHASVFVCLLGVGLLVYLVLRAGPATVMHQVKTIGWGMAVIILLGGVTHLVKTWAWRITLQRDRHNLSFARSFGLRLVSEAIGNLGLPGQVLGETARISMLGSAIPVEKSVSSATLDRGLFIVTSALVSVAGILVALLVLSLSGAWRLYALLFGGALVGVIVATAMAMRRRWPAFSGAARAMGSLPWFRNWLKSKQPVIDSIEKNLFSFYHDTPKAFWQSLCLNLAGHGLAILEVFLLLHFMGVRVSVLGAFVLEALTKLVNIIGAVNPGNVGTYEGGNMIFSRMLGIASASGLTLGLCRRARALFWTAVGIACLIAMSKGTEQDKSKSNGGTVPQDAPKPPLPSEAISQSKAEHHSVAVIVLAGNRQSSKGFQPALARVGTLPVVLRTILAAQDQHADRMVLCVESTEAPVFRKTLFGTHRFPESVEWLEQQSGVELLPSFLREVAATADRIVLVLGTRAYQPSLIRSACEWKDASSALALTTGTEPAGVYVLPRAVALNLADSCAQIDSLEKLHQWVEARGTVTATSVPADSWHEIRTAEDQLAADQKLDRWLVKPTDGVFARMNRRISIPISHQLIKTPISPNMVTLFTLGVSIAAGVFFALGGYWAMLVGAVLSVFASILDGCDGEVARIKLQSSDFGCWLDSICDSLYYFLVFTGIAFGLARSPGSHAYIGWASASLLFGASMSLFVTGSLRHKLSGDHPERLLAVWQEKADKHRTNPLLYFARQSEFVVRRCFFPYGILGFAVLNILNVVFIMAAVGSNLVWVIALYSWVSFSRKGSGTSSRSKAGMGSPATIELPS